MLTPSKVESAPAADVSGPQDCERRGWHRINGMAAVGFHCVDCGARFSGERPSWAMPELRKEGQFLGELGTALDSL
jgi:hypothetical protein